MDVLSQSFEVLRMRGGIYFRAALEGAWAIAVPPEKEKARLHLVLQGECYVRRSLETEPVRLNEGDMVIVSGGASHFLADAPGRKPIPLPDVLTQNPPTPEGVLQLDGDGSQRVRLLCGSCDFDASLGHPAIVSLPDLIVVRSAELGREPWLGGVLRTMAMEAERGGLGMTAVLTRLFEAVFVQAIRARQWAPQSPSADFLMALGDPKVSAVLELIHEKPEAPWTLTHLAKEIGLSRSVLADRFAKTVGDPPMTYLRRWRLLSARNMLRSSGLSIPDIAEACGYASVPSFSRRFTKAFGIGPGKYRKGLGAEA